MEALRGALCSRHLESHPGLRGHLRGVLKCFFGTLATICQTVSPWRLGVCLVYLQKNCTYIQPVSCPWWLRTDLLLVLTPPSSRTAWKPNAGSFLSDRVLPLKPRPGAGYWSGSCPIDLILSSLSYSERRMGFAYCFSLLHDWVCATDDTWHCPLPA